MRYEEMLPCPFCGGQITRPDVVGDEALIHCTECFVDVVFVTRSKQHAMTYWNNRWDGYSKKKFKQLKSGKFVRVTQ